MELELFEEVECNRGGKRSIYLENLIEIIFELGDDESESLEKEYHCEIEVSTVKHHALQFTHYYSITSPLIGGQLHLEVDGGIDNNGLVDYSFETAILPEPNIVRVLKDIKLDLSEYPESHRRKAQAILNNSKPLIFEFERKNKYDNYVTGGHSKMKATGAWSKLHLEYIYDEIEVDINFV